MHSSKNYSFQIRLFLQTQCMSNAKEITKKCQSQRYPLKKQGQMCEQAAVLVIFNFSWKLSVSLGFRLFQCSEMCVLVCWLFETVSSAFQWFSDPLILDIPLYLSTEMMSISEHFQVVTLRKIRQRMQQKQLSAFVMLNIAMKS